MKRNKHNLSHYKLFTCFPGELVPCGCVEVLPGDSFDHRTGALVRFSPMMAPLMHRVQARIHHFFVPMRLLWDSWEGFITGNTTPAPTMPTLEVNAGETALNRLADYFGVPPGPDDSYFVNALPFRAYNLIYNEWYRDQDLIAELDVKTAVANDFAVRKIAWQKDYFTAARPWPQKGPEVTLPLGTSAPVINNPALEGVGASTEVDDGTGTFMGNMTVLGTTTDALTVAAATANVAARISAMTTISGGGQSEESMYVADLTEAASATVNAIRRAMALQRFGERMSQFGSRYPELLLSMGVKSSDARLQRPEYLGGGKVSINFSEVLQTAEGETTPVGEMRGHGIAPGRTRPYRRFFEEHGYVISLFSVRPQAVYSTALPRMWMHGMVNGKEDFWTPELERIGQQEIFAKEIFPSVTDGDTTVWGYNDRYAEYKHQPSQVAGDFSVGEALDFWTWARGFNTAPALNQTFIECNPEPRIFADQVAESLYVGVNHTLISRRMLTKNPIGRIL